MSLGTVRGPARRVVSTSSRSRASARNGNSPFAGAEGLEQRTLLAAFVVNDAGDSGPGTLRQAILNANVTTGADTISFNIPGNDAYRTIRPTSPLPEVTGQTTIDGRTQAGVVIELDGSLAGATANGLVVTGTNSIVRGLVINRFAGHGIVAGFLTPGPRPGPTPANIGIQSNLIGTDVTGNIDLGNGGAGVVITSAGALVGGNTELPSTPTMRNVISGNRGPGIWVTAGISTSFSGPMIAGNYIGTNAGGSRALGNGREGILIEAGFGAIVGASEPARRNVISGNAGSGIRLGLTTSGGATIQNNYIGTNFAGSAAIPNGWSTALPFHDGITVTGPGIETRIGEASSLPNFRNLISGNVGAGINVVAGGNVQVVGNYIGTDATGNSDLGNGSHGIVTLGGASVSGNLISGNGGDGVRAFGVARLITLGGNYIGTNATGTAPLGNDGNGITLDSLSVTQTVGGAGTTPPPGPTPPPISGAARGRNLISANGGHGILVSGGGVRTTGPQINILNNYVGTDVTGTVPLGNGGSGVYIASTNVTLGTTTFAAGGNLISANGGNGVTIVGGAALGAIDGRNRLSGNRIGVAVPDARVPTTPPDPGTNTGMGNHGHGVAIFYSAFNQVGGGALDTGNVIAYNDGAGVLVEGSLPTPTLSNANLNTITMNSIYGNGGLGIDLSVSGEGVTPNDPLDADEGPNRLQNFPTVTEAVANATGTTVQVRFTVMGRPGTPVRVEVFSSPLNDPSGYGEGRRFLGTVNVTLDASGTGSGTVTAGFSPTTNPITSQYFTATATDSAGNTSEFSPAVRGTPAPPPPLPVSDTTVTERRVFYNDSTFDGHDAAGNTQDLAAIADDKRALLPGQTASFDNVTSYTKGINGIELLFFNPQIVRPILSVDDFEFRVGTGDVSTWVAGPAPEAVSVIPIPGPNSMFTLTWSEGAIRNTWLQVTVKANANTGLAAPDVFYFGNLVGEIGDASSPFRVSAADLGGVKAHLNTNAGRDNHYDFNRDGVVNALDLGAVRANYGRSLSAVVVTPPMVTAGTESDPRDESITAQVLG